VNEPIPLARPELGPREEELLLEVVRSGSLSLGPKLEQFEHDFSEWLGGGYAWPCRAGPAALHLGVRAMGWGEGDEVVTSPLTFVAPRTRSSTRARRRCSADIDPVTFNIDPRQAAAAGD
jgi:perosamine synthetase